MKKITIYIMLILVGSTFTSCHKEEPKPEFNITSIKQTFWKGTFRINLKDEQSEEVISFLFINDKVGQYEFEESLVGSFDFNVDGKLLRITGLHAAEVEGNWKVIEYNKNKLILKNELYPEPYTKILELMRAD